MVFSDTGQYLSQMYEDMVNGEWNTTCECYDFVPMKMTQRNGITRVVLVCTVCASKKTNGIKKSDYPNAENLQEYDDCEWVMQIKNWIQEAKDEALSQRRENFVKNNDAFWEVYSQYLHTEKWKTKSKKVIKRDPICKACEINLSTQAHHLTYKHIFNEPLFDLVGICDKCHETITKMDRYRKEKTGAMIAALYDSGELEL